MSKLAERSLGELVREDFRRADILEEFQIDFCCGGTKTLKEACDESSIALSQVAQKLTSLPDYQGGVLDVDYLHPDQLCDYIERKHHQYITKNHPLIVAYIERVYAAHGKQHPELATVLSLFGQVGYELLDHMQKEETILFPLIRKMVQVRSEQAEAGTNSTLVIDDSIEELTQEHENAGNMLKEISLITNKYQTPETACETYSVMLAKLEEFEKDLHMHVHLENNVLFPKIMELEKELRS